MKKESIFDLFNQQHPAQPAAAPTQPEVVTAQEAETETVKPEDVAQAPEQEAPETEQPAEPAAADGQEGGESV